MTQTRLTWYWQWRNTLSKIVWRCQTVRFLKDRKNVNKTKNLFFGSKFLVFYFKFKVQFLLLCSQVWKFFERDLNFFSLPLKMTVLGFKFQKPQNLDYFWLSVLFYVGHQITELLRVKAKYIKKWYSSFETCMQRCQLFPQTLFWLLFF